MIDLIRILIAPIVWLVSFGVIYGLQGLSCTGRFDPSEGGIAELWFSMPASAWLLAILVQVALAAGLRHEAFASPSPLVRQIGSATSFTALIATVWSFFPAAILSTCGSIAAGYHIIG